MLELYLVSLHIALNTATGEKLEFEFNKLRGSLSTTLANFRLSGMGDCPDDEKVKTSLSVYSSNFVSFCQGRPLLLYAYELLMREGDIFSSFTALMPIQAAHCSDKRNKQPMPQGGSSSSSKKHAGSMGDIMKAISAPISLQTPLVNKEMEQLTAKKMR